MQQEYRKLIMEYVKKIENIKVLRALLDFAQKAWEKEQN